MIYHRFPLKEKPLQGFFPPHDSLKRLTNHWLSLPTFRNIFFVVDINLLVGSTSVLGYEGIAFSFPVVARWKVKHGKTNSLFVNTPSQSTPPLVVSPKMSAGHHPKSLSERNNSLKSPSQFSLGALLRITRPTRSVPFFLGGSSPAIHWYRRLDSSHQSGFSSFPYTSRLQYPFCGFLMAETMFFCGRWTWINSGRFQNHEIFRCCTQVRFAL